MVPLADILNAVALLERPDGVIGFPTDTVYGLGCKIDHPLAVEKIFHLKGRPQSKPLVLMGADRDALLAFILPPPAQALALMETYWPGPLTIVLPRTDQVPEAVTCGFPTVALRIPDCPVFRDLAALVPGGVLATTSANLSGEAPGLRAEDVRRVFGETLDGLLEDDAAIQEGVASTVVAVEPDGTLRVLRTGSIMLADAS